MALDSLKNLLDWVNQAQEKFSEFTTGIDKLLGLQEKKEEITSTTKEDLSNFKKIIEEKERSPEEKELIKKLAEYLEHMCTPEDLQSFHHLFSGKNLQEDVANFLEEQLVIASLEKSGNYQRTIALQKAYEVYDADGYLQKLLKKVSETYTSHSAAKRTQETEKVLEGLIKQKSIDLTQRSQVQSEKKVAKEKVNSQYESLTTNIIDTAKAEVGLSEKDRGSDKYFRTLWYKYDTKKTPWCGAFVSWVLFKNGLQTPKNPLSAKSFLGQSWKWHVWIKVEWKVISGNYGDKVSWSSIHMPIRWFAIPTKEWFKTYNVTKFEDIPEWAIVVYHRTSSDKNAS